MHVYLIYNMFSEVSIGIFRSKFREDCLSVKSIALSSLASLKFPILPKILLTLASKKRECGRDDPLYRHL